MSGTEVIDDAISRKYIDEEIDKLQEELKSNNDSIWNMNKKAYKYLAYIRRTVLDADSVQPDAKPGRWVKHNVPTGYYYSCSLCNCIAPCTEAEDAFLWKLSNYCPDCGAKMEMEE